jgi:hypothetical protein
MTRHVHVHIGRLIVERALDRTAFERALSDALPPSIGVGGASAVADLREPLKAAAPRQFSGALGSAIGRALAGVAGARSASPARRPR